MVLAMIDHIHTKFPFIITIRNTQNKTCSGTMVYIFPVQFMNISQLHYSHIHEGK